MKMKALSTILGAAALFAADGGVPQEDNSYIPRPSTDCSKPATLTRKAWLRRKRRLTLAKASRRANR
jgi:hypothetical protein